MRLAATSAPAAISAGMFALNVATSSGGVAKKKFEAYALAASIIGKCHFCVKSHYELLKKEGLAAQQLRDIGRIAAVVNAAALAIAAETGTSLSA